MNKLFFAMGTIGLLVLFGSILYEPHMTTISEDMAMILYIATCGASFIAGLLFTNFEEK